MKTIGNFFDIQYGDKEFENKTLLEEREGGVMLISSKGEDNGVYGFYDTKKKVSVPVITVPRVGTIGQAFVQTQECVIDNNCLVLTPKEDYSLDFLFKIAYQIRQNKWKYKYGRQITPERLARQIVKITKQKIDWPKFIKKITPIKIPRTEIKSSIKLKIFKVADFFDIEKGAGSYLETLEKNGIPIVSTQISNNGVSGFYDIGSTFSQPAITVGRIVCNPRVQLIDFATVPDDLFVLKPKSKIGIEFLFFASCLISLEGWRFNYSRKVTKTKLGQISLPLPIRDNDVDFDYIEKVARNSFGFQSLVH